MLPKRQLHHHGNVTLSILLMQFRFLRPKSHRDFFYPRRSKNGKGKTQGKQNISQYEILDRRIKLLQFSLYRSKILDYRDDTFLRCKIQQNFNCTAIIPKIWFFTFSFCIQLKGSLYLRGYLQRTATQFALLKLNDRKTETPLWWKKETIRG